MPIFDDHYVRLCTETRRRRFREKLADHRSRHAQGGATLFDGKAAGGVSLVRRRARIDLPHPDLVRVDPELGCRNHSHRGGNTLAKLDFARTHADALLIYQQPTSEARMGEKVFGQLGHAAAFWRASAINLSMARSMRTCAPHRQRWVWSSCFMIWSRSGGSGLSRQLATVVMMPLTQ